MRPVLVAVLAFGFLVWDMSRNQGRYTHAMTASVDDFTRQISSR
jgi:hypothetical protein